MKNLKMVFSAFAVLAIVSGALAFKARTFTPGNIYCSSTAPISTELCSSQFTSAADFQTSGSGSTGNPCPTGKSAYINGTSPTLCEPLPALQKWVSTIGD